MADGTEARVRALLEGIVGLPLWSAVTGPRGNYVLSLELGEQQRRTVRLANPKLSFVKRTFEGTHSLLVECPWRVEAPDRILVSCFEAFAKDAPPIHEVGELIDRVVESVETGPPAWDLTLRLSGDVTLRCFSIEIARKPERNNWAYWSPEGPVVAGPAGRVIEQSRAAAEESLKKQLRLLEGEEPSPLEAPDDGDNHSS
jgi:hypothetical protein